MSNKYQEDFLWFSYFGITKNQAEDNKDDALKACTERAYLDLCRRLTYKYSFSDLNGMKAKHSDEEKKREAKSFEDDKDEFRNNVIERLIGMIQDLLSSDEVEDFDAWHKKCCNLLFDVEKCESVIRNASGEDAKPNVGIAQKWINMTIKYMLVMGLWDASLLRYKEVIHIPLDSYVFRAAEEKSEWVITVNGIEINGFDIGHTDNWSDIVDYDEYFDYQKKIRSKLYGSGVTPIEWEGTAWIEQARKKK